MVMKSLPLIHAGSKLALLPFLRGVVGKENVPQRQPFVLVCNHSSFIDGVLLASVFCGIRRHPLHMVSIAQPFSHWLFGWGLRSGRNIPLDRSRPDGGLQMMRAALGYLAMGEPVGLFPEGHVNKGRYMRRLRPGAVLLALEAGVPLLPAGVRNSWKVLPMGQPRPHFKRVIEVHVGAAVELTEESQRYSVAGASERASLVRGVLDRLGPLIATLADQEPPRIGRP